MSSETVRKRETSRGKQATDAQWAKARPSRNESAVRKSQLHGKCITSLAFPEWYTVRGV